MTSNKTKLKQLNSGRTRAITEYINILHDKVDELYEALIDSEILQAAKVQKELSSEIRGFKIEQ